MRKMFVLGASAFRRSRMGTSPPDYGWLASSPEKREPSNVATPLPRGAVITNLVRSMYARD